jgi:hypothetical protein
MRIAYAGMIMFNLVLLASSQTLPRMNADDDERGYIIQYYEQ